MFSVALHKAAHDHAGELLGHAAISDVIHVQAVGAEIVAVTPLPLKFTHRVKTVHHQDASLAGDVSNRANHLLVISVLHQGFPVLRIDENDIYSGIFKPTERGLETVLEFVEIDVAQRIIGPDLPN